jgi:hypothetical protein
MGVLLTIIAWTLLTILGIPAVIVGVLYSLIIHKGNSYFKDTAISLDQTGNVVCQYLFNLILIKKNGYRFGNPDETISSVLGKNNRGKTLTKLGQFLANLLNKLDRGHTDKAIDENP